MLPEDAFWAARIVSRFSDEAIRAIVREGDFRAPEAEAHLANVIIQRRDKVLGHYLGTLNPLADFRVAPQAAGALAFTNYGEDARVGQVEAYEYQWFALDNDTGRVAPLAPVARVRDRAIPLPAVRPEYLMVRIRTRAGVPAWTKAVDVFLRRADASEVVGVDRESGTQP
jgi:hypothetical protein